MKRKIRKFLFIWIVFLILILGIFIIWSIKKVLIKNNKIKRIEEETVYNKLDFDEAVFYKAIGKINKQEKFPKKVRGGIIPHDLLVGDYIADYFQRLALQNPQTIVLIGPNHFENGEVNFILSNKGLESDLGEIDPDLEICDLLEDLGEIDNELVLKDHAINGIVPFIQYYLPKTKIVPIIVSKKTQISDVNKLVENLREVSLNKEIVVIASVDFSHYLSSKESDQNDEISLREIKNRNYEKIMEFNSDFMDSPASIVTLLKFVENDKNLDFEVLKHSNSGEILKNEYIGNTSYYSMVFYMR